MIDNNNHLTSTSTSSGRTQPLVLCIQYQHKLTQCLSSNLYWKKIPSKLMIRCLKTACIYLLAGKSTCSLGCKFVLIIQCQ